MERLTPEERLYAPDVARLLKCSVRAARRKLASWERRYGTQVVARDWGGVRQARRYTTAAGMASTRVLTATQAQRGTHASLAARVAALEEEQDAMRGKMRDMADMLAAIDRRIGNENVPGMLARDVRR